MPKYTIRKTNVSNDNRIMSNEWFVEAHVPKEGDMHIGHYRTVCFSGPGAREHATEYMNWKNTV